MAGPDGRKGGKIHKKKEKEPKFKSPRTTPVGKLSAEVG